VFYSEAVGVVNCALLLLIVCRGLANSSFLRYPVFFTYIAFELVSSLVGMAVAIRWGLGSSAYFYVFSGLSIVTPLLQLWVLWDLLRRLVGESVDSSRIGRFIMLMTGVLGFPVLWSLAFTSANVFVRYQAVALVFQMIFSLLIYVYLVERRDIDPGRNLKWILAGFALMVGCQSLNYMNLLGSQTSYNVFQFLVPTIYLLALSVFVYAVWGYEPVRRIERRRDVNLQLQRGVRSVLQLIFPRT